MSRVRVVEQKTRDVICATDRLHGFMASISYVDREILIEHLEEQLAFYPGKDNPYRKFYEAVIEFVKTEGD